MDILPTVAAITGAPLPKLKIDGVNLLPLITGKTEASPREFFAYYYKVNDLEAIRNDRFKLVLPHKHRTYEGYEPGMNGYPGKVNEQKETGLMLFDLWRDPGERYDVQLIYPGVVNHLTSVVAEIREDLGDDLTGNPGKNRRAAQKIDK
jgi:arylsulfatase